MGDYTREYYWQCPCGTRHHIRRHDTCVRCACGREWRALPLPAREPVRLEIPAEPGLPVVRC